MNLIVKRNKTLFVGLAGIVIALSCYIAAVIGFGTDTKAYAATTPKYTMTVSGTLGNLSWGASGLTSEIINKTKISVRKGITSGDTEDLILYISGSSTSGSGVLADNGYINFTDVNISCTLSAAQLTLSNSAGKQITSGKGSIKASLSSSSNETYRVNLYLKKQTGAGYTQWGYPYLRRRSGAGAPQVQKGGRTCRCRGRSRILQRLLWIPDPCTGNAAGRRAA